MALQQVKNYYNVNGSDWKQNQATGYASQHIWRLPQARINWGGLRQEGHPA